MSIKAVLNLTKGTLYFLLGINRVKSKQRLELCNKCPFNKNGKCALCGCYLFAKTRLDEQECPVSKW